MTKELIFTMVAFNSLALFVPVAMFILYARPAWWHYLFALFLGIITAWIDRGASQVQVPALLLIVFGLFIGFAQPRDAWRSALLIGVWIPLAQSIEVISGIKPYAPGQTIGSLLALGFAFAGTYMGVFVNHFSAGVQQSSERQRH